nr:hypothetical protein BaRGS_022725 [Batillaria attramentaria]
MQCDCCPRRVCYYTNWSQYRPTDGKFVPEDVDPMMCTHLIFAFATLKNNLLASYEWNDESTPWMKGIYDYDDDDDNKNEDDEEKETTTKETMMTTMTKMMTTMTEMMMITTTMLKTLLAVGGWNMASKPFTKMVANQARRQKFADHSVIFLKKHGFDGLDLDWEYPARRGSPPEDKARFAALVRQLRQTYDADAARNGGTPLLLTAAVPAVKDNIDAGYNVHAIIDNLDFISLMAYDFHGGTFDSVTGPNSPLFAHFTETGKAAFLNVDWAARYWVDKGAPKHKLVIGVPVYGRTFTLTSFTDTDLGAPSRGGGNAGTYTREKGFLAYYEICTKIATANVTARIQDMKVPYLVYNSDQWVGYDDAASLREKVRYIRKHGFGGVMVWALPLDDFSGKFCRQGKYPLWSAVVDECGN